jgi:hypothetical protein
VDNAAAAAHAAEVALLVEDEDVGDVLAELEEDEVDELEPDEEDSPEADVDPVEEPFAEEPLESDVEVDRESVR